MEISVREFKDHLSEYLRRVQAGAELVVTSHGKPVARLVPPPASEANPEARALVRLRSQPWIRAGKGGKPMGPERPIAWPSGEKALSRLVLDARE